MNQHCGEHPPPLPWGWGLALLLLTLYPISPTACGGRVPQRLDSREHSGCSSPFLPSYPCPTGFGGAGGGWKPSVRAGIRMGPCAGRRDGAWHNGAAETPQGQPAQDGTSEVKKGPQALPHLCVGAGAMTDRLAGPAGEQGGLEAWDRGTRARAGLG